MQQLLKRMHVLVLETYRRHKSFVSLRTEIGVGAPTVKNYMKTLDTDRLLSQKDFSWPGRVVILAKNKKGLKIVIVK